ncbi:MAG TPA: hypothetical protein VNI36_08020 [Candidatus Dormibacteraeota bacterium]|nr:hypothetical protein [Candidatus Dormibacteraeota bacterium]
MKTLSQICCTVLATGLLLLALPALLAAQATGSVEFTAHVAPTGGRPEPVRELTFYLLTKSMADIRVDAQHNDPAPDMNKFIDSLKVSPKLKSWMKKHHTVRLVGEDFIKSLTADDIMDVPEFFTAYMSRNVGFKGAGFPEPKFKVSDREAHPDKFKQEKEEYMAGIRKFIAMSLETIEGIDAALSQVNPSVKWDYQVADQRKRVENRSYELAEERYLAAQTDTDLNGHGSFENLTPGNYWISLMAIQAISGDVRLRWDVPVTVRAGETSRIALNNFNAEKPGRTDQNVNQ